jgi:hypothetical protein
MTMLGFSNSNGPHAPKQAQPKSQMTAEKKPGTIIHPMNAPRTISTADGYPDDFGEYKFAGATVELVASERADGTAVRRPAVVALMLCKRYSGDTFIEEEMTASVKDLQVFINRKSGKRGHPDTHTIMDALNAFYESKIPTEHQETAYAQIVRPILSLFSKLN